MSLSHPLNTEPSAELAVAQEAPVSMPSAPSFRRRQWQRLCWMLRQLFGALTIVVGLAVLAATPVLQLLSFGYMLELSGRISRSGRLRDGFIGLEKGARIGSVVLGVWLMLLPLRALSSFVVAARIIAPEAQPAKTLGFLLKVLSCLALLHIFFVISDGGRLRSFFWPFGAARRFFQRLRAGGLYQELRDGVWDFAVGLRLPFFFSLGLRGLIGTMAWLLLPTLLLAIGAKAPPLGLLGGLLLAIASLYLPFAQAQFAQQNRLRSLFALGTIRSSYRRAPIAFFVALGSTLSLALPLYLLKIEAVPREASWLPSLFFIAFMLPARFAVGWALGRANHRDDDAHFVLRWPPRLAMLPLVGFYALVVFFSQYISWEGTASLFGQHAFLVPVPFLRFPG